MASGRFSACSATRPCSVNCTCNNHFRRCCNCVPNYCNCVPIYCQNSVKTASFGGSINAFSTRSTASNKKTQSSLNQKKPLFNQYVSSTSRRSYTAPQPPVKSHCVPFAVTIRNEKDMDRMRDFRAVRREDELLEEKENRSSASGDHVLITREEFDRLMERAKNFPSSTGLKKKEKKCAELSQPAFNSTQRTAKKLQEAVKNLEHLPKQAQLRIYTDKKIIKQIEDCATDRLNVPLKARLYKDLAHIEPEEAELQKNLEEIKKSIAHTLPQPRNRDEEPDILMFNKPTFTRIRPKLPGPPTPFVSELSNVIASAPTEDESFRLMEIRNEAATKKDSYVKPTSRQQSRSRLGGARDSRE